MASPNETDQTITLLRRILDALYRPIRVWWVRKVTARCIFTGPWTSLNATTVNSPWMPVGEFTELLVTFVNQNSTTGAATGVSVQFQVMDPLNGAAVNFGATVALTPVNSGGVTIGLTSTTLTGFGGWIRAAITTTTATLNGNLFINFQGK